MSRSFEESLSFEVDEMDGPRVEEVDDKVGDRYDDWLLERKIRAYRDEFDEYKLGDSCCFGTHTAVVGLGCVWKLHGGV